MKEWLTVNILQSRTAWAAGIALILGTFTWLIFVAKTPESWVAFGTFLTLVFGGWTAINKVTDNIISKGK